MAELAAAKKRGKVGGRPKIISNEKMLAINSALGVGSSKAAICLTLR